MDDLISRQAAIDAANDWLLDCLKIQKQDRSCGLIRRLEDLPSARQNLQPTCNQLATDAISRQQAIDALKEHRALFCDNTPDTFSKLSYGEKCRVDELDTAISTLVNLPSAQPTQTDTSNTLKALDCVERQAAIDAICYECLANCIPCESFPCGEIKAVQALPSAQPERKTGYWIWKEVGRRTIQAQEYPIHVYVCSECGYGNGVIETPYCPNCGADMRGEEHEN